MRFVVSREDRFTFAHGMTFLMMAFAASVLIYCVWDTATFLPVAEEADGTVLGFTEEKFRKNPNTYYYPHVQYRTKDGKPVEFTSRAGNPKRELRVGDSVRILYDPRDPSRARFNTTADVWGGVFVGAFAFVFTAPIFLIVRRMRKKLSND